MKKRYFTSQSRFNFNIDTLLSMGVRRAYVTPFTANNEALEAPQIILQRMEELKDKADIALKKGLEVYPFFVTINHPEGNYRIPSRYRIQQNIDGTLRPAYICFRDEVRQSEMIRFAEKAAQLGFKRIMFDDDLRDAFCYCDEHINGFDGFKGKTRGQIAEILNGVLTHPEYEQLRLAWYHYKYDGMKNYARRIEQAVHQIDPYCRIGLCTSAKRCQDFSGRDPVEWLELFSTEKAPSFVRLCGECYDDSIFHLAQSSGWHDYFNRLYPDAVERKIEITSVPAVAYRSPGTVILETKAVLAVTGVTTVHWAWAEEFEFTGLTQETANANVALNELVSHVSSSPCSLLAIYIGQQLGAYTPTNISIPYGATHDPINVYNIVSLTGIPVMATPQIPDKHPAILCSAYISREMISTIDAYAAEGGVAILDAKAAQCYRIYGGQASFAIIGPVSWLKEECSPSGEAETLVANCLPDAIYTITSHTETHRWIGRNIEGQTVGNTITILPFGKGKLIIVGYDFSRTKTTLIHPAWRQRLIEILKIAGVQMPVYWDGPVAVQCHHYSNGKIALINYNANAVCGNLFREGSLKNVNLKANTLEIIT